MRIFLLFFGYLTLALGLSALLAAPLYRMLNPVVAVPFDGLVLRLGMLIALGGAWWFLRRLTLANKAALGYGLPRYAFIRVMLWGLVAGVAILAPLVLILIGLDVRSPEPDGPVPLSEILKTLARGALGGLLIGLIEETFFRGALYSGIVRGGGATAAVLLSSLLYAAMHFIDPPPLAPNAPLYWYSGLAVLADAFHAFAAPSAWFDSFLCLFMVGVFLAVVRGRTGHIAGCIGLHAGWVLTITIGTALTDAEPAAELAFLVGAYDHITGLLAAGWLVLITLVFLACGKTHAKSDYGLGDAE